MFKNLVHSSGYNQYLQYHREYYTHAFRDNLLLQARVIWLKFSDCTLIYYIKSASIYNSEFYPGSIYSLKNS